MKKYIYSDGYIILNEKGNTYTGEQAHRLWHMAKEFSRESGEDFQACLYYICNKIEKRVKELIKK